VAHYSSDVITGVAIADHALCKKQQRNVFEFIHNSLILKTFEITGDNFAGDNFVRFRKWFYQLTLI